MDDLNPAVSIPPPGELAVAQQAVGGDSQARAGEGEGRGEGGESSGLTDAEMGVKALAAFPPAARPRQRGKRAPGKPAPGKPGKPNPAVPRRPRPWTEIELSMAVAWRAETPARSLVEIGRRLGRTGNCVRKKLTEQAARDARGGSNPVGYPRAERQAAAIGSHTCRDNELVEACRRDGGFTAFSTHALPAHRQALCAPLIAAGGLPRPPGWKDGRSVRESEAETAHMEALKAVWRAQDEKRPRRR